MVDLAVLVDRWAQRLNNYESLTIETPTITLKYNEKQILQLVTLTQRFLRKTPDVQPGHEYDFLTTVQKELLKKGVLVRFFEAAFPRGVVLLESAMGATNQRFAFVDFAPPDSGDRVGETIIQVLLNSLDTMFTICTHFQRKISSYPTTPSVSDILRGSIEIAVSDGSSKSSSTPMEPEVKYLNKELGLDREYANGLEPDMKKCIYTVCKQIESLTLGHVQTQMNQLDVVAELLPNFYSFNSLGMQLQKDLLGRSREYTFLAFGEICGKFLIDGASVYLTFDAMRVLRKVDRNIQKSEWAAELESALRDELPPIISLTAYFDGYDINVQAAQDTPSRKRKSEEAPKETSSRKRKSDEAPKETPPRKRKSEEPVKKVKSNKLARVVESVGIDVIEERAPTPGKELLEILDPPYVPEVVAASPAAPGPAAPDLFDVSLLDSIREKVEASTEKRCSKFKRVRKALSYLAELMCPEKAMAYLEERVAPPIFPQPLYWVNNRATLSNLIVNGDFQNGRTLAATLYLALDQKPLPQDECFNYIVEHHYAAPELRVMLAATVGLDLNYRLLLKSADPTL